VTGPEAVRYAVAAGVATLTMDQPHNRNALTPALLGGLAGGLEAALADQAVRVIVLTHAGPAFCAGADLSGGRAAARAGRHPRHGHGRTEASAGPHRRALPRRRRRAGGGM
jgi:enoyl-CoA hydratase/carnithine racemase